MNRIASGRKALPAGSGASWPELTGVKPRTGSFAINEAVACWAAEQGYPVLAMVPLSQTEGGKKPLEEWKHLRHRSPEQIRQSRAFYRPCGVAILTGKSGLVVVDIDSEEGEEFLRTLAAGRPMPETLILQTHNGRHLIFRDGGVDYKTQAGGIADGIDIRGRGGIIVIFDPGQPERHFTSLAEPAALPGYLAEVIPLAGSTSAPRGKDADEERSLEVTEEYLENGIPPGKQDDTLLRLAMRHRRQGLGRESWYLIAKTILSKSDTGVDARGNIRTKFTKEGILGFWDTADAQIAGEASGTVALAPLPRFPTDEIPGPLRGLIKGSPALPDSTLAGFGLAVMAGLCGYAAAEMPGGDTENAILWNAVISGSGTAKSPSLRRTMAPVHEVASDLLIDPTITVEALARKLAGMDEPTGLIASDELKGFLQGIGQYKHGGGADRAKFMELWNSGHEWHYTRIGNARKGLGVDEVIGSPVISVCGGLTPEDLRLLGNESDGYRARWLPFVSEPVAGAFEKSLVPEEWAEALRDMYEKLPGRRTWVIGRGALRSWEDAEDRWLARRRASNDPAAVLLALNKATIYASRLALVLAESVRPGKGGTIPAECMDGAVAIMDYCLDAWAYLGTSEPSGITIPERMLEEKVIRLALQIEKMPGKCTDARSILRNQWCGIADSSGLEKVLAAYARRWPGTVREERKGNRGPKTKMVYAPPRGN